MPIGEHHGAHERYSVEGQRVAASVLTLLVEMDGRTQLPSSCLPFRRETMYPTSLIAGIALLTRSPSARKKRGSGIPITHRKVVKTA